MGNSKKAVALVLTAMMTATALAGCSGSSTSTTSTGSNAATSGSSATASQVSAADVFGADMTAKLKDAMAKEAENNSNKISLKVWCSGDDLKFEKYLAEKFKEVYKDNRYTFDIKFMSIGEDKASGKIIEDPKVGADVFSFADDQLRALVDAGAIAKVSNLFNANVIKDNTDKSVAVCSIDGTPYAFPKTSDNGYFLYYDKRVYKNAKDVESFDTLVSTAAKSKKNVLMAIDNAWYNAGFFFTAGCTVTLKDSVQTADYNTDKGLSAVKAMCHLAESSGNGFTGSGDNSVIVQGFQSGTLAAAVTGTWNGPAIRDAIGSENVGAAKLPTVLMDGSQKQLDSFGGYKIMGVNANTKFTVAAQALAYYFTCPDSQQLRYSGAKDDKGTDISRGLIPTSTKALESDAVKSDPAAKAIEAQRPYSQPQSNVGGKYWAAGVDGIGGAVNAAKGKLSDSDIKDQLNKVVKNMAG